MQLSTSSEDEACESLHHLQLCQVGIAPQCWIRSGSIYKVYATSPQEKCHERTLEEANTVIRTVKQHKRVRK
jgi:hypothetical protein